LVIGTAPRMLRSSGQRPVVTSIARRTARPWAATDSPWGSRWTTIVRLSSGNPNSSAERCSACNASASWGTRSPSAPTCASRMVGSHSVHAARTATQPAITAQRQRTISAPQRSAVVRRAGRGAGSGDGGGSGAARGPTSAGGAPRRRRR